MENRIKVGDVVQWGNSDAYLEDFVMPGDFGSVIYVGLRGNARVHWWRSGKKLYYTVGGTLSNLKHIDS